MPLKNYLAIYTVIDGEHAYVGRLLIAADNDKEALRFANWLTHDTDCWDEDCADQHPWSYNDGTTASRLDSVREISEEQFKAINDVLGLLRYDANRTGAEASGGNASVT